MFDHLRTKLNECIMTTKLKLFQKNVLKEKMWVNCREAGQGVKAGGRLKDCVPNPTFFLAWAMVCKVTIHTKKLLTQLNKIITKENK